MFKTEMHLHSRDASPCARAAAKHIAEKYAAAGYHTIVVTNHLGSDMVSAYGAKPWKEYVDLYLHAYDKIRVFAGSSMHVLLGAEVRFGDSMNDYLVYGLTPEYLYAGESVFTGNFVSGLTALREAGMLVYQAHPFRVNMKIIPPQLVDGYEAFNGSPGHGSSNDMAYHWAMRCNKPMIAGTDHHNEKHKPNSGILTESEICTNADLLAALRSQDYLLVHPRLEHEQPENPPLEFLMMMAGQKPGELPDGIPGFPPIQTKYEDDEAEYLALCKG